MTMRKTLAMLAVAALFATAAVAHGGKSHKLMGTLQAVQQRSITIVTPAGEQTTVRLTEDTRYEKEGKPADHSALEPGLRVSIDLTEDDTTAVKVKIGSGGGSQDIRR
jgi:hypothetical protein